MDKADAIDLSVQLIFGITGMFVLAIFIIIFFLIYQRRLLREQERANRIEADYQRSLLNAGILAQEAERERMAIELHDSVGGLLSATKIYLNKLTPGLPEGEFAHLKSMALKSVSENIKDIRSITNDLLPQSLERVGLVAAVAALGKKLETLAGAEVTFEYNHERRFQKNKEKALFRILQELTNNTLKHAGASEVQISLVFSEDQLQVTYRDNGRGFDPEKVRKEHTDGSLGLKSIESRAAFLGATLAFHSQPGRGVEVVINLKIS